MSVRSTTTNLGLIKYARGHSVRDIDLGTNMDLIDVAYQANVKVAKGTLADGSTNDIAFAWQNPESSSILVQRVIIDVTTGGGTATSDLDVGVVANATSTAVDIIDALDLEATGVCDHLLVSGAGVGGVHKVAENGGASDWITGKITTANALTLVGKYYIEYVIV